MIENTILEPTVVTPRETKSAKEIDLAAGVQRIELTLKKIGERSNETLHAVPKSSACTSGCFSTVSSIETNAADLKGLDDSELEKIIRMHDKVVDVMGEDALVAASIAKGVELRLAK